MCMHSVKGLRRFIITLNLVCLESSRIEVIFKSVRIRQTIKLENICEVIFSMAYKRMCVIKEYVMVIKEFIVTGCGIKFS